MIVNGGSERLLKCSVKFLVLPITRHMKPGDKNAAAFPHLNKQDYLFKNKDAKLCDCKKFHSSKDPRSSIAKLSPQDTTAVLADFYHPDCTRDGLSCLDCRTRKLCMWWFGALIRVGADSPCSDSLTNYELPYCDSESNQCVAQPLSGCAPDGALSCLRPGDFYPDLANCRRYYSCREGTIPKQEECGVGYVYKQQWRKCVINLLSSRDCIEPDCTGREDHAVYPGDASLHYKCTIGVTSPQLKACSLVTQEYDIELSTCLDVCDEHDKLAVPSNCGAYYDCVLRAEVDCPNGQGFNARTRSCTPYFDNLCNELALLESNIYSLLGGNFIFDSIQNLFNFLNFSPYAFIFIFRLPDYVVSTIILVEDYIYNYRGIPPGLISFFFETVLSLIPPEIRQILNMFLTFLPFRSSKLSNDHAIALAIENEFAEINVSSIISTIHRNPSIPNSFKSLIEYLSVRIGVSVTDLYAVLQLAAPTVVHGMNDVLGFNVLETSRDELHLNSKEVFKVLQSQLYSVASEIRKLNEEVGDSVKNLFDNYEKEEYAFVESVVEQILLPLHV